MTNEEIYMAVGLWGLGAQSDRIADRVIAVRDLERMRSADLVRVESMRHSAQSRQDIAEIFTQFAAAIEAQT